MPTADQNEQAAAAAEVAGRHDDAARLYEEAARQRKDAGERDKASQDLVNAGQAHEAAGDHEKQLLDYNAAAVEYLHAAKDLAGAAKELEDSAAAHRHDAATHRQAAKTYERASDQPGLPPQVARAYDFAAAAEYQAAKLEHDRASTDERDACSYREASRERYRMCAAAYGRAADTAQTPADADLARTQRDGREDDAAEQNKLVLKDLERARKDQAAAIEDDDNRAKQTKEASR